ncbi:MAG: methylated-DNA--[protein]-cysteine S-methyltransferase [Candidatus Nomurabacteria bacterium]|jgi:O-6-methylguanine DNA methyltransferase|nr:methylated-DNA--[protein]-cysteine S-methyltransferase [Candidatus Nomurabacteria bacterium]
MKAINKTLDEYLAGYPLDWRQQVQEYLAGKRRNFDVGLTTLPGTEFQQAVWRAMLKIQYSQTKSYKQIAKDIGRPKAFRAVANACGANPYPIIIPCHRVVASHGLGGFSLGLDLKKKLLRLESTL